MAMQELLLCFVSVLNGLLMLYSLSSASKSSSIRGYLLTNGEVLFGKIDKNGQRVLFLEALDVLRLISYVLIIIYALMCYFVFGVGDISLVILKDVVPMLLMFVINLKEVKNIGSEKSINRLALFISLCIISGFSLQQYNSCSNIQRHLQIGEIALYFTAFFFYAGFKRDIDLLNTKYEAVFDLDMSQLLNDSESESTEDINGAEKLKMTPEDKVGFVSKLTFYWLNEVMSIGYARPLEEKDFYDLRPTDKTNYISNHFEAAFDSAVSKNYESIDHFRDKSEDDRKNAYFIIVKALFKSGVLKGYAFTWFLMFCFDVLDFIPPHLLNLILKFMSDDTASTEYGLGLIVLLAFFSTIQTFVDTQRAQLNTRHYFRVRAALQSAIYQKSLRLSSPSKSKQTVGQITNLLTTDVHRIAMLVYHSIEGASTFFCLVLATIFLYRQLGYATFVAEALIVLTLPLTSYISRKIDTSQDKLMKVRDKRIKVTTQLLGAIKAIKLYAWDKVFRNKIEGIREEELSKLRTCIYWELVTNFVWPLNSILMTMATFATYTLIQGKTLDAATTFTTLSLLSLLNFPLGAIPGVIMSIVESRVSLKRVSGYMLSEEVVAERVSFVNDHESDSALKVKINRAFWDDKNEAVALSDVELDVKKGDLCFVTGLVGSGKSGLLHLLINELSMEPKGNNEVIVNGSVAYTNQVPWIQNATVKENILFGKPYEKQWYETVVHACALVDDLNQLPHGDTTEIGERGINLSGGQKARLALARAVYSRHDILLLETCFEAVDEHVGDHIWQECFLKLLKGKRTVICVTHALKRLQEVDHVLLMSGGKLVGQGTFQQLLDEKNEDFIELVNALEKQQAQVTTQSVEVDKEEDAEDKKEQKELKINTSGDGNELTGDEEKKSGEVSMGVYIAYLKAAGGLKICVITSMFYLLRTALDFLNTRWLAYSSVHFVSPKHHEDTSHMEHLSINFSIPESVTTEDFLGVYSVIAVVQIVFLILSTAGVMYGGYLASRTLHNGVLFHVIRSPMSFFNTTPTGRILNRFSKDVNMVDEELPYTFLWFMRLLFSGIGTIFSISFVAPQFLIALPFTFLLYRSIQKFYISSQREMQRWSSILKSPLYSFFTETLEGTTTVRGYRRQADFTKKNMEQSERINRSFYLSKCLNRWLSVRVQLTGNILRTFAGIFIVLARGRVDAGLAGLAFTYSFRITSVLNWMVRSLAYLETELVSVERLAEYLELKSEAPETKSLAVKEDKWPSEGRIELHNVEARYREGLPLVLKGINLVVEAGEKVGIVGRTGAGKSSLFLVLMRLVEPCNGKIVMDGLNLQSLGTLQLRSKIAVIPQDPMLFAGTVKENLDPANNFSGAQIVTALKTCRIHEPLLAVLEEEKKKKKEGKEEEKTSSEEKDSDYPELDIEIAESGSNFSFGQRQLFCIARAVLRNCKVLLLDEATSGIDLATDAIIQETIREQFKDKTVLTIAHRIETIIGGDKVAVMADGRVEEYDSPQNLLRNEGSMFSELVRTMKSQN